MKIDEDFMPDRRIEIETDDEENEAERDCDNDSDSDCSFPNSPVSESDINMAPGATSPPWPQSYRQSMDMYTSMTPPSISFLKGSSSIIYNMSDSYKRSSTLDQSSLSKPFFSGTSLDYSREEVPTSTLPITSATSTSRASSVFEFPPPVQLCSFSQSILNAINVLSGIGILSVPYALKEGGWLSLSILFFFGTITCYTGILLKNCLQSSSELKTYPDIGQAAFGVLGRICIAIVLYLELYCSCVEFLIMMSDNLSSLFPNAHLTIAGIHLDSYQLFAIISTLVILPTVWLRNLSLLSYISVGGVATLAMVVLCLLWLGVVDGIGYHPSGKALDFNNLPVSVGIIGFCYGGHSVFPNIYSSMREPSRFPSVLIISFVISFLLYAAVGVYGFLIFGDSIRSQFTLNMPTKFVTSKVAAWTVVVAPVTKYALTLTPIAFCLEELLPSQQHKSYGVSVLIRTLLVLSTLVVALTVPYFGVVMALIGSLFVMLISIIFPCVCYLSILHGRLTKFQSTICGLIIVVGVASSIMGTYSALASIPDKRT